MLHEKFLKSLVLVPFIFILMGNSGCDTEEERRSGRHLKRSASFLGIDAAMIKVNDDIQIDLKGMLNNQYLEAVNNSEYFISVDRFNPVSFTDKMNSMASTFNTDFTILVPNTTSSVCTNDLPDTLISGSATDFEMTLSGGLSIGLGGLTGGLITGANVSVERMVMSLDLHAFEPLTFSGGLNLNLFGLTFNPSVSVPDEFASVTKRTLRTTIDSLGSQIEQLEFEGALEPWSARVYAENDSHVLINAGRKHGLKVGDYLWISNMDYEWEGDKIPCESPLRFQRPRQNVEDPLAVVEIVSLGLDNASAKVIRETQFVDIEEGAKAFVLKLQEEDE